VMKHTLKATAFLVLFFFIAQVVGLLIINQYIDHPKTIETHKVEYKPLPYNLERPQVENESTSFIYIMIAVIIGTLLVLMLVKLNKGMIWKVWFFITIWLTLSIAFAAFMNNYIAAALGLAVALFKILRPNIILQNLSEIFVYGGLASIFVPILNVFAAFMLLIVISVYDYIAVNKTGHMVELARFQSKSQVFAGLFIPYERKEKANGYEIKIKKAGQTSAKQHGNEKSKSQSVAVLGGGDIGFALIFAGVAMKTLMLKEAVLSGFLKSLIIPIAASVALTYLLFKGQKNKFYPAMPVISIGCFAGFGIIYLIGLI
jgi:presenilin-like A22 family membrane protease